MAKIKSISRATAGTIVGGALLLLLQWALAVSRGKFAPKRQRSGPFRILLTGRFDSKNWCNSHLIPLSRSAAIAELLVVVDGTVELAEKCRRFPVPGWLGWLKPRAIVRSLWAIAVARREKPDAVMSYSLFPAGLFGLLAARWTGAAAILQLPGGPREVEAGGWVVDDRPWVPPWLKARLVPLCRKLCGRFDLVVVRGRNGEEYVRRHSSPPRIAIVRGSVNPARFAEMGRKRTIDLVFVGRIDPVKQPAHVCEVVQRVARRYAGFRVVVAGRGPLLESMRRQANEMGLGKTMRFIGHVERVEGLVTRSRIFLLTSRSEGLSIAMAEAMLGGAVPVVPEVGDLNELVVQGRTGWLVQPGNFDEYADRICQLLENQNLWSELSQNARHKVLRENAIDIIAARWTQSLEPFNGAPASSAVCQPVGAALS